MFNEEMMYGATIEDLMKVADITEEELFSDDSTEILDEAIQRWGFEHPCTISIARLIERRDVSKATLRATLEGMV